MSTSSQITRDGDGFFLEVELTDTLNFLLFTKEADLFYELRMGESDIPQHIRPHTPTLKHLYMYLLKNHNHPRAFCIDNRARLHVSITIPGDLPVEATFSTTEISKESTIPDDEAVIAN
jgi:hypothetical protein